MNMHIKWSLLVLAVSAMFSQRAVGQIDINPKIEIGVSGNGFVYHGDLSSKKYGDFKDMQSGIGAYLKYYFSPVLALRLNGYYGKLRGNDADFSDEWRLKRAYRFSSPLTEVSLTGEADFFGKGRFRSFRDTRRHYNRWGAYILAGAGLAFVHANRDWSGLNRGYFYRDAPENIGEDSLNTPDHIVLVFPLGLGVRYDASKRFSVFVEAAYRFTFTDNLDGYKYSVYSSKYDGYTTYSCGVAYRFDHDTRYRRKMLLQ